ncbi:MAG: hypothetical protein FWD16_07075, partial [Clostridia bacterium]|nr:hypothetical protein [Clostridia bacterium]
MKQTKTRLAALTALLLIAAVIIPFAAPTMAANTVYYLDEMITGDPIGMSAGQLGTAVAQLVPSTGLTDSKASLTAEDISAVIAKINVFFPGDHEDI